MYSNDVISHRIKFENRECVYYFVNNAFIRVNSYRFDIIETSGVRRVSVLGGSAEDAQFWCIIAVDILGAGDGSVSSSAKHGSYEGSISLKQHFCFNFSISGNLTILR